MRRLETSPRNFRTRDTLIVLYILYEYWDVPEIPRLLLNFGTWNTMIVLYTLYPELPGYLGRLCHVENTEMSWDFPGHFRTLGLGIQCMFILPYIHLSFFVPCTVKTLDGNPGQ